MRIWFDPVLRKHIHILINSKTKLMYITWLMQQINQTDIQCAAIQMAAWMKCCSWAGREGVWANSCQAYTQQLLHISHSKTHIPTCPPR